MKALLCTLALWIVCLAAYSQSFTVPTPKGLQCSSTPTWPLNHTKKPSNLQLNATSKTGSAGNTSTAKPATAVPAIPLIKLWLMTEGNSKEEDN